MTQQLIITSDGSHTIMDETFHEHYHSIHGAIGESVYVFIEQGLKQLLKSNTIEKPGIKIFEVGFGTGLNAFLTFVYAENSNTAVDYASIEISPLDSSVWHRLNYPDCISPDYKEYFYQMHRMEWNFSNFITPSFFLIKIKEDLEKYSFDEKYDLVYFDAFSPKTQPGLWSQEIFDKIFKAMNVNGILVTYSSSGDVRRTLIKTGFLVEKIKGPHQKRHMLRAVKIS